MLFSSPALLTITKRLSPASAGRFNNYSYSGLIWLLGGVLIFLYAAVQEPQHLLPTFLVSLVVLQIWQCIFCTPRLKNITPNSYTILNAMLFSLLLPLDISIWMLLLCVSFGCVFGERVFGGRGYSFLNPVTVGLAFYLYSLNIDTASSGANLPPQWLVIGIAGVLILLEQVSWRTLMGLGVGLVSTYWLLDLTDIQSLLTSSGILITFLFLAGDTGSGGSTNLARWFHGVLCGTLVALLYAQNTQPMLATVFAILLSSMSAPLLDYFVVQMHTSRRRHRNG